MAVCGDRPPFSNRILKVHLWEKGKNFMNKEKNIRWIPVLCFGVLMLGLGSSDSLRGIFSPVFQEHYSVGGRGLSMMVVISYVGNLLFLSVGGKMMDTFDRKKVAMGMLGIWMAAVLLNVLTDSYPMILLSMFLALGASTMLNTTVNLLTPMVCAGYAGMMVNIFFFIQGIGTSGSQFLLGRFMTDLYPLTGWKVFNIGWLSDNSLVLYSVVFVKLWQSIGYFMVIYLAGLQLLPQDPLEAAVIDGCTGIKMIRYITIPLMKPTAFVCIFLAITESLNMFPLIMSLTNGGPGHASENISLYIYNEAFKSHRMGYASALAVILTIITTIIAGLQMKLTREDAG